MDLGALHGSHRSEGGGKETKRALQPYEDLPKKQDITEEMRQAGTLEGRKEGRKAGWQAGVRKWKNIG